MTLPAWEYCLSREDFLWRAELGRYGVEGLHARTAAVLFWAGTLGQAELWPPKGEIQSALRSLLGCAIQHFQVSN